jgi:hypothetical protein
MAYLIIHYNEAIQDWTLAGAFRSRAIANAVFELLCDQHPKEQFEFAEPGDLDGEPMQKAASQWVTAINKMTRNHVPAR